MDPGGHVKGQSHPIAGHTPADCREISAIVRKSIKINSFVSASTSASSSLSVSVTNETTIEYALFVSLGTSSVTIATKYKVGVVAGIPAG